MSGGLYLRARNPLGVILPREAVEAMPELPLVVYSGVYLLIGHDGEVLYVGQSVNIAQRVTGHLNDWLVQQMVATVRYIEIEKERFDEVEAALIRYFRPRLNGRRWGGRHMITPRGVDATREDGEIVRSYLPMLKVAA